MDDFDNLGLLVRPGLVVDPDNGRGAEIDTGDFGIVPGPPDGSFIAREGVFGSVFVGVAFAFRRVWTTPECNGRRETTGTLYPR